MSENSLNNLNLRQEVKTLLKEIIDLKWLFHLSDIRTKLETIFLEKDYKFLKIKKNLTDHEHFEFFAFCHESVFHKKFYDQFELKNSILFNGERKLTNTLKEAYYSYTFWMDQRNPKRKEILKYWKNRATNTQKNILLKLHYLKLILYYESEEKNNTKTVNELMLNVFEILVSKILTKKSSEIINLIEEEKIVSFFKPFYSENNIEKNLLNKANKFEIHWTEKYFFYEKLNALKTSLFLIKKNSNLKFNIPSKKIIENFLNEEKKFLNFSSYDEAAEMFPCSKFFCTIENYINEKQGMHFTRFYKNLIFVWVNINPLTKIEDLEEKSLINFKEFKKQLKVDFKIDPINTIYHFRIEVLEKDWEKEISIIWEEFGWAKEDENFLSEHLDFLYDNLKTKIDNWSKESDSKDRELCEEFCFFCELFFLIYEKFNYKNNFWFSWIDKIFIILNKIQKYCPEYGRLTDLDLIKKLTKRTKFWPFPWNQTISIIKKDENYFHSRVFEIFLLFSGFSFFKEKDFSKILFFFATVPVGFFNFLNKKYKNNFINFKEIKEKEFNWSANEIEELKNVKNFVFLVSDTTKQMSDFIKNNNFLESSKKILDCFENSYLFRNFSYAYSKLETAIKRMCSKDFRGSIDSFIEYFELIIFEISLRFSDVNNFTCSFKKKDGEENFIKEKPIGRLIKDIKKSFEASSFKQGINNLKLYNKCWFFIKQIDFLMDANKMNFRNLYTHNLQNKQFFKLNRFSSDSYKLDYSVFWLFQTATQLLELGENNPLLKTN